MYTSLMQTPGKQETVVIFEPKAFPATTTLIDTGWARLEDPS